ncbi:unnamed protein product [Vitrella brassicaformis CCMP3155]|uniref:Protein FAM221A n=2 Tax=Vitrella brassicaformis TaxID=1169539 RepID=A0A0G4EU37_VITBC|nr:unnamed protein product [Vitrella brassicaformis CCMP3155]|eukprot:CEM01780.1 unnamed protein product [Vitrella brassicaformis CCMP3155]
MEGPPSPTSPKYHPGQESPASSSLRLLKEKLRHKQNVTGSPLRLCAYETLRTQKSMKRLDTMPEPLPSTVAAAAAGGGGDERIPNGVVTDPRGSYGKSKSDMGLPSLSTLLTTAMEDLERAGPPKPHPHPHPQLPQLQPQQPAPPPPAAAATSVSSPVVTDRSTAAEHLRLLRRHRRPSIPRESDGASSPEPPSSQGGDSPSYSPEREMRDRRSLAPVAEESSSGGGGAGAPVAASSAAAVTAGVDEVYREGEVHRDGSGRPGRVKGGAIGGMGRPHGAGAGASAASAAAAGASLPCAPKRMKVVVKWTCTKCKRSCIPVRDESRCLCGHRLREHHCQTPPNHTSSGAHDGSLPGPRLPCSRCPCKHFFFIVSEGAWILRCSCKHRHIEHDPVTHACNKPGCGCTRFFSPFVCNCDHPWSDHVQTTHWEEVRTVAQMLAAAEDFQSAAREVNDYSGLMRGGDLNQTPINVNRGNQLPR